MHPSSAYLPRFVFAAAAPLGRREFAIIVMCALLLLAYSADAAADQGGHSIPPQIGVRMLRHSDRSPAPGREGNAHARNDHKAEHRHDNDQRPAITPEQAAQRARDRFGGRVLNVILERGPGGPYYRVKLLEHGRVRVVDIDARR